MKAAASSFALATAHFSCDSTPSSCHHAGDEGNESHEGNEVHEEGHEAQGDEGCRGGGTDEGNESHEGNEGHEEGHEAQGHEESRGGGTSDESNEGNEGHEEVNGWKCESLPLIGNGHERCLASSRGGVPRLALLYTH